MPIVLFNVLDEQRNVGIGCEFKECSRTANLASLDEVLALEAKDVHGHLAADELDIKIDTHIP